MPASLFFRALIGRAIYLGYCLIWLVGYTARSIIPGWWRELRK